MGRKIEVYWNSKVKAFSVREDGKVVGHATKLLIREATFSVGAKGREKELTTGHKNVHAFIRGELSAVVWQETFVFGYRYIDNWTRGDGAYASAARKRLGTEVRYNPRLDCCFVDLNLAGNTIQARSKTPMAFLRVFDKAKPVILAFDPCLMTEAESRAATR